MAENNNMILSRWGCNICFEDPREPVCTTCGHLFCWPCLYAWVHDMAKLACPVCRAPVTLEANVVPVYVEETRAEPSQVAPTSTSGTPPRPHAAGTRRSAAPSASVVQSTAETQAQVASRQDLHREQLRREQLAEVHERALIAQAAQRVLENDEYLRSLDCLEAEYGSLSFVRRGLMLRRNAIRAAPPQPSQPSRSLSHS